jgi:hypothetical protein
MPGHSGESECRDGVKSAAKVRCALLQPIQHRHWCICLASPRSVTPSRPPLAPSLIALLSLLEAGQAVPRPLEARRRLRLASRQRLPGLPRPR